MGHKHTTSKKQVSKAGKILGSKKSSKKLKSLAAGVLGNAGHKKKRSSKKGH